jgi:hypothetical protein
VTLDASMGFAVTVAYALRAGDGERKVRHWKHSDVIRGCSMVVVWTREVSDACGRG